MPKQREVIIKIATDLIICSAVGFPVLAFFLKGEPTKRGYFCDDDSIRYPYYESTISDKVLYLVGFFFPAIVFSVVEFCNDIKLKKNKDSITLVLFGRHIPPLVWQLYVKIGVFVFGACLSQLTTDIGKYTIGRLRPHFLNVCDPNILCSEEDPHNYIENFTCKGDPVKVRQARLSFPSGHSSFSTYTMVYLAIYLQARMHYNVNKLLRPFLQFIALLLAYFTVLSRVMDYKHHWSDVLVGSLLGFIIAVLVALFISDLFPKAQVEDASSSPFNGDGPKLTDYNTIDLEQQTS